MSKVGELFWSFAKIGSFTFGGGYAMVSLIQHEVVERKRWLEKEEFVELLALAQSSPGPIALNTAVFVGYRVDRYRGAMVSTLGVVIPSFVVILTIALFFSKFRDNPVVEAVFKGIRPAVVALILAPIFGFSKGLGWWQLSMALVAALAVWYVGFSPVYLVLAGVVGGILYGVIKSKR